MKILTLVCDQTYPQREEILNNIQKALEVCGGSFQFQELTGEAPDLPTWTTGEPTPAVFVDGVALHRIITPGSREGCILFKGPEGNSRVPGVGQLVSALNSALRAAQKSSFKD